jgi:Zn-dependent protease with chaperone function
MTTDNTPQQPGTPTTDAELWGNTPPPQSGQAVHVLPYRNEEPLFWISAVMAVYLWVIMIIFTLGLIIPIMLFIGLLGLFAHSLLISWIKGNAVKVTAEQFPDLHALYSQTCARLGIQKVPELYLAQADGMLNAMATRFMRRDYVVLLSDLVDALQERPQAIKFYMGHELGHVQRKHLSRHWWLWPGMIFPLFSPAYSRACEYTCDRYGMASCDNLDDAKRALAVLVAGLERWKQLNFGAFEAQAAQSGSFWMAVNELTADYPWLCKRMRVLEDRNAQFPRRSFWAWLIALVSPRMGYGGAVVGFLYWLMIGGFILFLVAALAFGGRSKDHDDGPGWFEKSFIGQVYKEILKDLGLEKPEPESMGDSPDASSTMSPDEANFSGAYGRLASVAMALESHAESNKKRAPATLTELKTEPGSDLDIEGIQYQLLRQADAKSAAQMQLQTAVDCETCSSPPADTDKPVLILRRDAQGEWTCHARGFAPELLEKQEGYDCKPE